MDLPRINALWARLDDYATSSPPGWQSIDLTGREYPTFDGHPWGPYYVHYTMDYYADFLRSLNAIHLRSVLADREPYLLDMLHSTVAGATSAGAPVDPETVVGAAALFRRPGPRPTKRPRPKWKRIARRLRARAGLAPRQG